MCKSLCVCPLSLAIMLVLMRVNIHETRLASEYQLASEREGVTCNLEAHVVLHSLFSTSLSSCSPYSNILFFGPTCLGAMIVSNSAQYRKLQCHEKRDMKKLEYCTSFLLSVQRQSVTLLGTPLLRGSLLIIFKPKCNNQSIDENLVVRKRM